VTYLLLFCVCVCIYAYAVSDDGELFYSLIKCPVCVIINNSDGILSRRAEIM